MLNSPRQQILDLVPPAANFAVTAVHFANLNLLAWDCAETSATWVLSGGDLFHKQLKSRGRQDVVRISCGQAAGIRTVAKDAVRVIGSIPERGACTRERIGSDP